MKVEWKFDVAVAISSIAANPVKEPLSKACVSVSNASWPTSLDMEVSDRLVVIFYVLRCCRLTSTKTKSFDGF